jgi:hypothetical protein
MATPVSAQLLQIALRGDEGQFPLLLDISSFLYDFNLLYEFMRIKMDDRYSGYTFSFHSWNRKNRRLREEDRLRVVHLRHESPIELVTFAFGTSGAVAAVWGVLQIAEKIGNWPLNREILKLQRDKLRKELAAGQAGLDFDSSEESLRAKLQRQKPWEELTAVSAEPNSVPLEKSAPLDLQHEKPTGELPSVKTEPVHVASEEPTRDRSKERDVDYFVDKTVNRLERGVVRIRQIDVEIISESQIEKR